MKTNIGHTEAAAGIAGLMKAVLIARHGVVPGSLHLREPQPALTDSDGAVQVVAANQALAAETGHALLGVSSFGLSGTNAHVVVARAEEEEARAPHGRTELPAARPAHLLVLSARSRTALLRLAGDYADFLSPGGPGNELPLWDICATAALHRDAHPYRLWATGADHEDLAQALRTLAQGGDTDRAGLGEAGFQAARRTVFVFPGQGSQWAGMGQSLLNSTPAFETAITACDAIVRAETGRSVTQALADGTIGDDVAEVQPILWAMEVALAATWRDMGVDPAVCVGHSMGEVAAAAVTGALPLADAAAVICRRSALMRRTVGQGAMMSVDVSAEQAADLVAAEKNVCVAAENAPSSTILAGDAAALRRIGRRLDRSGVFHRIVRVNVASHSPAMDPLRDDLLAALAGLTPRDGTVPLYSTARDTLLPGSELDAGYWMENLRQPVRFLDGIRHLVKEGDNVFVEVSPHPVLQMAVDDIAREAGAASGVVASTTRKSREEPLALARSLGAFFAMGGTVDWERWFRGRHGRCPAALPVGPRGPAPGTGRTPRSGRGGRPGHRHHDEPDRRDREPARLRGHSAGGPSGHAPRSGERHGRPVHRHAGAGRGQGADRTAGWRRNDSAGPAGGHARRDGGHGPPGGRHRSYGTDCPGPRRRRGRRRAAALVDTAGRGPRPVPDSAHVGTVRGGSRRSRLHRRFPRTDPATPVAARRRGRRPRREPAGLTSRRLGELPAGAPRLRGGPRVHRHVLRAGPVPPPAHR